MPETLISDDRRGPGLPRRSALLRSAALLAAAVLPPAAHAAGGELRVVTGDDSDTTREIVQALSRRNPGLIVSMDVKSLVARKGPGTYMALGPTALLVALEGDLNGPLLSLFTSSETFQRLVAAAPPRNRGHVTAIHAEASPGDQLRLVRAIYGRRVSVGVLLSAATQPLEAALRQAARTFDLQLETTLVGADENAVRALVRLRSCTVILAVPDREVYNAVNFRNILESTYRRGQTVIGFSTALVNAGALATVYSTIADVAAQAAEVIDALHHGRAVEPRYPAYWRVAVNRSVAQSMTVVLDDAVLTLSNPAP